MDDRNRLGEMIRSHWMLHHPQMVEELRQSNRLEQAIIEAQERTGDLLFELVSVQKMDYHAAWEIATQEWAYLPTADRRCEPNSTPNPENRKNTPPATSE